MSVAQQLRRASRLLPALLSEPGLLTLLARIAWRGRDHAGRFSLGSRDIEFTHALSLFVELKDIFANRIYDFQARCAEPRIIDGGACIGISLMRFKELYPACRVTCFEPDPKVFAVLQRNVAANRLEHVTLVSAGLSATDGDASFLSDGSDGGRMTPTSATSTSVKTVRLSSYLDAEVDLLKLNIEGQEWPVLQEVAAAGKLRRIRQLILEYHGWPDGEQPLGRILELLASSGFRYLVHDFDELSSGTSKPPFELSKSKPWFCLVFAQRID